MTTKLKTENLEGTVEQIVSNAFSELASLGDEMRERADNMESANMGHLPACEAASEAADTLEGLDVPDAPASVKDDLVEYAQFRSPRRGRDLSRAARRDNAVQALNDVIMYLDEQTEALAEKNPKGASEIEDYREELDNAATTAETVEFPGMFGR